MLPTKSGDAYLLGGVYGTTLMLLSVDTLTVLQQSIVGTKPSTFISCQHTHAHMHKQCSIYKDLNLAKSLEAKVTVFQAKAKILH